MTIQYAGDIYDCKKAVRNEKNAILYLSDGGTVKFFGVSTWNEFQVEGGSWETEEPTELEQIRADLDYLSVMTGVPL